MPAINQADIAVKEKNIKSDFSFNCFLVFSGSPWGRTGKQQISRTAVMASLCGKGT
jgi:hypothetical protein